MSTSSARSSVDPSVRPLGALAAIGCRRCWAGSCPGATQLSAKASTVQPMDGRTAHKEATKEDARARSKGRRQASCTLWGPGWTGPKECVLRRRRPGLGADQRG